MTDSTIANSSLASVIANLDFSDEAREAHADALEEIARLMDLDGIGGHPVHGHVAVLRSMAYDLRAGIQGDKVPFAIANAGLTRVSPIAAAALSKAGIEIPTEGKIPTDKLNAALAQSGMSTQQRFALKTELAHAGFID